MTYKLVHALCDRRQRAAANGAMHITYDNDVAVCFDDGQANLPALRIQLTRAETTRGGDDIQVSVTLTNALPRH